MAVTLNRSRHEPTAECHGVHCHIHHVDEDDTYAYRWCLECGHVYRTRLALRLACRREYWGLSGPMGHNDPLWLRVKRTFFTRINVDNITFCQECTHDF